MVTAKSQGLKQSSKDKSNHEGQLPNGLSDWPVSNSHEL